MVREGRRRWRGEGGEAERGEGEEQKKEGDKQNRQLNRQTSQKKRYLRFPVGTQYDLGLVVRDADFTVT